MFLLFEYISLQIKAETTCTITDERPEFIAYKGQSCKTFSREVQIDRGKAQNQEYSGNVNVNGYPLITADLKWKICNDNTESDEYIKLRSDKTVAKFNTINQEGLNTKGNMKPGKCRSLLVNGILDSEKRCKYMSFMIVWDACPQLYFCLIHIQPTHRSSVKRED